MCVDYQRRGSEMGTEKKLAEKFERHWAGIPICGERARIEEYHRWLEAECLRLMAEQEWVKVEERLPELPNAYESSEDVILARIADDGELLWWERGCRTNTPELHWAKDGIIQFGWCPTHWRPITLPDQEER